MKQVGSVIFLVLALISLLLPSANAAVFPPNELAPVKGGKLMVRLGDLQVYPGRYTKKLKGTAYFATVVVERVDLQIEEGKMIYDCTTVPTSKTGSLACEDLEYIRPQKR